MLLARKLLSETVASGGGWDLSTASYDSVSFIVFTEGAVGDLAFKGDGTKMYMLSFSPDAVYQYSLSTAWDLSTASYDSVNFSVASEDGNPLGLAFKGDGTKMYILGNGSDTVYQYSLSTAWDVSTASYDSVSFGVASEDSRPYGLAFKGDGTKMYMIGNTYDTVYQYSLSTAWDLSTTSYDSVSFSVPGSLPFSVPGTVFILDLAFKDDGTKMYLLGNGSDTVYQYSLSTAWDLSTASYDSVNFSVASEAGSPYGLAFKDDGTKMYIADSTTGTVYQYSLS